MRLKTCSMAGAGLGELRFLHRRMVGAFSTVRTGSDFGVNLSTELLVGRPVVSVTGGNSNVRDSGNVPYRSNLRRVGLNMARPPRLPCSLVQCQLPREGGVRKSQPRKNLLHGECVVPRGLGRRDRTPARPDHGRFDAAGTARIMVHEHSGCAGRPGIRAGWSGARQVAAPLGRVGRRGEAP